MVKIFRLLLAINGDDCKISQLLLAINGDDSEQHLFTMIWIQDLLPINRHDFFNHGDLSLANLDAMKSEKRDGNVFATFASDK